MVTQNTDRWGNVVSITDPRSSAWKTTYRYNANNQLVQQVQTDSDGNAGADANGNVVNANAPVTQIYFDALGRQVAVRDARDNVNVQVWDAGGKLVQERHADGGVIDHRFNAFGNEVATVDARRKTTTSTYDKLDRLVRTVRPAVGVYTSGFGLGGVVATDLGTRNLQETQRWDQAGRKLSQTNANNETVKYAYDLRGNLVSTTQLRAEGSATPERLATIAAYDARNHKIIEVDANGSDTTWRYDYFGQLQARTDLGKTGYGYSYDNARQLSQISGGQGQTMHYDAAGQLVRIDDTRVGTTSTYAYDLGGRRLRETTIHNGAVYQDNAIAYDALGRMRWVADTRAYVSIDYDKAGNRTRVTTKARDVGVQANSDTAYTYDAMNRQLTAGSHTFAYDANGNRTSDTDSAAGGINESYDYDALNRLTRTSRSDGTFEARAYDAASRVVQTAEEGSIKSDDYDDNGRLVASTQLKGTASALSGSNTTIYFYDAAGNAVNSLYVDSGSNASSHTHTTYVAGPQGYQQKTSTTVNARGAIQIDGSTGNTTGQVLNGAASTTGSVTHHYDANGNKHLIVNDFEFNTSARNRNFVYDAGGRMLWTDDGTGNHIQRQLVVNGEALGQYGETVAARVPLNGAPNYTLLGYSAHATFDFASQRMSGLGTNPGVWVVREGDTLQSIAKSAYGDPSLWYRIAEANGLSDNADLVNGQALTLPVVLSNASNVNTFTPYDPSKLVGDITPTMLDLPQPKQDKGCGGLGQVIVIVVAAVVTYFTGGAAAGVLGNIAGYAVGGAVGSIAGQAVGIAIGVQDSFSWKAVALAAIGGGISGAVGGINLFDAGTTAGVIGNAIVRGAIGNAASQGIAVATGLQDKFSWKSVAASAVSAGIGQGLNAAMDYNPSLTGFELGKSLASGLGGSLAAQVVRGGKISTTTLASDAFGNIIGDSLAWANSTNNPSSSRYENQMDRMSDADPLDSFLARNNNFNGVHANGGVPMVNGRNFSQDAAARRAGINPAGLPTYVDSGGTPTGYGIEPSGNGILGWQDRMSTQASTVRAGDYGGSMERIARAQLGSGASQRDINNYVGQLIEINGIKNPRTVGGDWDIALPGVGTPAATNGLGVHGKDIALGESLKNAADRAQQQSDAAQTATATAKETAFDSASVFAPRDTSLLNLRPRTLADEIALQQARNTPQLRGWDPRIDGVQESTDSALLNYLSGQGNMALGGVAASITMLASGNIRTASMATDIAAPIDSLVAPMGGSGRTAAASGLRRGPPHLVPNEALETELILRGNASRAKIVEQIDNVAQPAVDAFLRLDPDARVGFRGSLASGLKGEHKIDANGNRVAFDGEVAYQKNRAEKYQSYSGEQGYDADFFVVSDKLAARYGNKTFINRDNAPRFDPSLRGVLDKFDEQLRSNPILSGMKSGAPEFRIWSEEAMSRKNNDPQTYLPLGKFK